MLQWQEETGRAFDDPWRKTDILEHTKDIMKQFKSTHRDTGALVTVLLHLRMQLASAVTCAHEDDRLAKTLTVGEDHFPQHACLGVDVRTPVETVGQMSCTTTLRAKPGRAVPFVHAA